jgi:hypothetical protein
MVLWEDGSFITSQPLKLFDNHVYPTDRHIYNLFNKKLTRCSSLGDLPGSVASQWPQVHGPPNQLSRDILVGKDGASVAVGSSPTISIARYSDDGKLAVVRTSKRNRHEMDGTRRQSTTPITTTLSRYEN